MWLGFSNGLEHYTANEPITEQSCLDALRWGEILEEKFQRGLREIIAEIDGWATEEDKTEAKRYLTAKLR